MVKVDWKYASTSKINLSKQTIREAEPLARLLAMSGNYDLVAARWRALVSRAKMRGEIVGSYGRQEPNDLEALMEPFQRHLHELRAAVHSACPGGVPPKRQPSSAARPIPARGLPNERDRKGRWIKIDQDILRLAALTRRLLSGRA
jgi:hypothetical protein